MKNKTLGIKLLYWIMFRLMDCESILWWVADHIIKPTALLRRYIAKVLAKKLDKEGLFDKRIEEVGGIIK